MPQTWDYGYDPVDKPDSIKKRVKGFHQQTMDYFPVSTAHLVTNAHTITDQQALNVAELMDRSQEFLRRAEHFAGMSGKLISARQKALDINDEVIRNQAMSFLDNIQSRPVAEQNQIMDTLYRDPGATAMPVVTGRGAVPQSDSQQAIEDAVLSTGGSAQFVGNEELEFANEDQSVDLRTALEVLFPDLRATIGDELYKSQYFDDITNSIAENMSDRILNMQSIKGLISLAEEVPEAESLGDYVSIFLREAPLIVMAPVEVGFNFAGEAFRQVPGGTVVTDFFGREARAAEKVVGHQVKKVLAVGLEPIGKDPVTGEPIYSLEDQKTLDERAGVFVFLAPLLGVGAGKVLAGAGRRLKIANTAIGAAAAVAELEVKLPNVRTAVIGRAAEVYRVPVRTVVRAFDKQIVKLAKNPDEWFARGIRKGQGNKLLDAMEYADKHFPTLEERVGHIYDAYGKQLNDRLLRAMMEEPTREGRIRVFTETMTNKHPGLVYIHAAQKRLKTLNAMIERAESPAYKLLLRDRKAVLAREINDLSKEWHTERSLGQSGHAVNDLAQRIGDRMRQFNSIDQELNSVSAYRLERKALEWKLKTTFDDSPMLTFPKQNVIRAAVRAPTTAWQRRMHALFIKGNRILDPAKTVDDLPSHPVLNVQGHSGAPVNAKQANLEVLSTYMRRAGVPDNVIHQRLGEMANIDNQQLFFDFIEHKVFGEGGDIDQALATNVQPQLRKALIRLHDTAVEGRTWSQMREGKYVLGKEELPGEYIPHPSRPSEFAAVIPLPDVKLVIEANSWMDRGMASLRARGALGSASELAIHRLPQAALHVSTAFLKPLVMIVRIPAMAIRIQLEQSLRISALGYKPWKGLPDGLSLFPGGIPIPGTKVHLLADLFGKDGWKLLDPDPKYKGLSAGTAGDYGMFLEDAAGSNGPTALVPESTVDFRTGQRVPQPQHYGNWLDEWEAAHVDRLDRKIAELGFDDPEQIIEWLRTDPWAMNYMEQLQQPVLDKVYPQTPTSSVPDGTVLTMAASDVAKHVEFPDRLDPGVPAKVPDGGWRQYDTRYSGKAVENAPSSDIIELVPLEVLEGMPGNKLGKTDVPELAASIREGGLNEPLVVTYDPSTGRAVLGEGNHRTAALRAEGYDVAPVTVQRGTVGPDRGIAVDAPVQPDQFGWFPGEAGPSWIGLETRKVSGRGRTPDQTASLSDSIRTRGYDPDYVDPDFPEFGRAGEIEMEFNPHTGEAIVREKSHRIGIAADEGQAVPVKIKIDEELSGQGHIVPETILPRIKEPVDQIPTWINSRIEYLRMLTKDDPRAIRAIATGRWRTDKRAGAVGTSHTSDGKSIVAELELMDHKLKQIEQSIAQHIEDGAGEPHILVALHTERKATLRKLEAFEAKYPQAKTQSIRLADKNRMRNQLKAEWEAHTIEMPDRLMVEKRVRPFHHDGGVLDDMEKYTQALNNTLYRPFKILSYADKHGTRGSLFLQAKSRWVERLEARGYDHQTAVAIGHARAAEFTRDVMYDLTARSSTHRALKDIFWFAPAYQEVLYTWLVKIPADSYWPVGAAGLTLKAAGIIDMLEAANIVSKNSDGERVIQIPGSSKAIEKLTGLEVPDIVFGKLTGLNIVSTGAPGMSTAGNFVVGKAALKWGGPFKVISDILQPYGPETAMLPSPVTHLWEAAMGEPPPWDFTAPDYVQAQWDRAHDTGIQYAFTEMQKEGLKPPRPEDFGTKQSDGSWVLTEANETAYKAASKKYITDLFNRGEDFARGGAVVKLLGSTLTPMALYTTSTEREEWVNFWDSVIAPAGFGDKGLSDAQHEQIDDFLERFPNSMAYSVYYSGYGEKKRDLPFGESEDDAFYDKYYTGERLTLSPEDYSLKLMATESRRFYANRLNKSLDEISPGRDPWELLTNGRLRKDALNEYSESYDRYLFLNPRVEALLQEQSAFWRDQNNEPVHTYEAERLQQTILNLDQLSAMFTGEEAVRGSAYKGIMAELKEAYSDEGTFGAPNTPTEKAMGWWFDRVLQPYFDKTGALYEKADEMRALGLPVSDIYNQIREISNAPVPMYKGQPVPGVEEVFFGNRTVEEQKAAINTWTTRPLSWLSNFQLEKVGYTATPVVKGFLENVSQYDEEMYTFLREKGWTSSSTDYLRVIARRKSDLAAEAERLGPDAVTAWNLNETEPYQRLDFTGFGAQSATWTNLVPYVTNTIDAIKRAGDSPKGYAEATVQKKVAMYIAINDARRADPEFDMLWKQLSAGLPLPNGLFRDGATLYEAVLFGNFSTQYMNYEVVVAGSS